MKLYSSDLAVMFIWCSTLATSMTSLVMFSQLTHLCFWSQKSIYIWKWSCRRALGRSISGFGFVDSFIGLPVPVLEDWGRTMPGKSIHCLKWIWRCVCLIHPRTGSYTWDRVLKYVGYQVLPSPTYVTFEKQIKACVLVCCSAKWSPFLINISSMYVVPATATKVSSCSVKALDGKKYQIFPMHFPWDHEWSRDTMSWPWNWSIV